MNSIKHRHQSAHAQGKYKSLAVTVVVVMPKHLALRVKNESGITGGVNDKVAQRNRDERRHVSGRRHRNAFKASFSAKRQQQSIARTPAQAA